jgi:hypothetical protein
VSDYYAELHASGDPTRAAGWRHPIEQAMRFEVALELAPSPLGSILDLGCAAAALREYVDATGRPRGAYTGVELYAAAAALGAPMGGEGDRVLVGDLHALDLPACDAVFAVGAAVDGRARGDLARVAHVARLVRRAAALARGYLCVVALDQRAVEANPILGAEPALLGVSAGELGAIARDALGGWSWRVRRDFAPSDVALVARRAGPLPEHTPWHAHRAALDGPWGQGLCARERAWLWYVSGAYDAAARVCDEAIEAGDPRAALLRERIDAAR